MQYMFDDFKNIRTFPANTRVYRDGIFLPEISDEKAGPNLPLHIIHIGKLTGRHNWFIDMNDAQNVFLTARIETFGNTKIRLEINPNLRSLGFDGKLMIKNSGDLTLEAIGNNNMPDTKIKVSVKLLAAANSKNRLTGLANIPAATGGAETDIGFAALCAPGISLLQMSPSQRISSVPAKAEHSASIFRPAPAAIQYLETAGLSAAESSELLNQVFMEEAI